MDLDAVHTHLTELPQVLGCTTCTSAFSSRQTMRPSAGTPPGRPGSRPPGPRARRDHPSHRRYPDYPHPGGLGRADPGQGVFECDRVGRINVQAPARLKIKVRRGLGVAHVVHAQDHVELVLDPHAPQASQQMAARRIRRDRQGQARRASGRRPAPRSRPGRSPVADLAQRERGTVPRRAPARLLAGPAAVPGLARRSSARSRPARASRPGRTLARWRETALPRRPSSTARCPAAGRRCRRPPPAA